MACSIIRNKQTNEIEKVLAPNGKESKLYQEILKVNPDKEAALRMWAQVYTPSFKEWFGDWENGKGTTIESVGDVKSGVQDVFKSNPELANAVYNATSSKRLSAVHKLTETPIGDPVDQTEGTGLCDGTCGIMAYRLKKQGMSYGTAEIDDKYANYHAVALTEIDGKRFILNQPQLEFMSRGYQKAPVWERAQYWKGDDTRMNRHLGELNQFIYGMDIPLFNFFTGKSFESEYGEISPVFKDITKTEKIENVKNEGSGKLEKRTIIYQTAKLISNPKVSVKWTYDKEFPYEEGLTEFSSSLEGEEIVAWTNNVMTPRLIEATEANLIKEYKLTKEQAKASINKINQAKIKEGLESNKTLSKEESENAKQLFQKYVNLTGKQDIEGFKEFVSPTFDKQLAQKIQDKLEKLYPEIKLNITNNPVWEQGDNIFNQRENKEELARAILEYIQEKKSDFTEKDYLESLGVNLENVEDPLELNIDFETIQDNYEKAIGRTSTYIGNLIAWLDSGTPKIYKPFAEDISVLVGPMVENILTVSHFAPSSLRKGAELILKAANSNIPIVMAVPEYQAGQLEKSGFRYVGDIPQYFNGKMVIKKLMINYAVKEHELQILYSYFTENTNKYNQTYNNQIIGQANIKAGTILIDAIKQKQDTLPHEYAHHYIAWFRDSAIVQEAIKKWGSEEALVQSIGEQVVLQKGEALNWWNNFVKWIMNKFNSLSKLEKQELTQILTDAFLTRQNLGTEEDAERFKKFIGEKTTEGTSTTSNTSKVVDENGEPLLVYHGTNKKFDEFDKELRGENTGKSTTGEFDSENAFFFTDNPNVAFNYGVIDRYRELSMIAYRLEKIVSEANAQENYNKLREESPKFAEYIDGLKKQGLTTPQIKEKLIPLAIKYGQLSSKFRNPGSISNPRRYFNDIEEDINELKANKNNILSKKYTPTSKYNDITTTDKNNKFLVIYGDGIIRVDEKAFPSIVSLADRNITTLTSEEFDKLTNEFMRTVTEGRNRIQEKIKEGGFTPEMMPVFLNAKNVDRKDFEREPFVMQMDGTGAANEASKMTLAALKSGKDGVVFENIADPEVGTNYGVFEPNQIKSVFNQGTFSKETPNIYLQKEKQSPKESNEQIDTKIKNFLASIGVNIQTLANIRDRDGNLLNAVAKADMLNKIIQVVEGKADITTLSEEASHFFVEMLGTENALYKEMYNQITGYKIYKETVNQYKDIKMYRNADGTINFDKIKKEAIGKLIMAHIIKNETGEEVSDKINTVKKWWAKVWDFIKKVFNVATTNPFQTAAESITTGDISELDTQKQLSDEEFLQATVVSADSSTNKLIADQDRIKLDDSLDSATGEKKHIYTVDGKPVLDKEGKSRSVNSVYVDIWYKERFPTDNRSERQRMIDSLKADEGTKIHLDMQDIIERYFDEKGDRRTVPVAKQKVSTNAATYSKLETYFNELLQQYKDPKTKFLAEVRIYDPEKNVAGTIDLVIILPDGSVDIYDWKSQEVGKNQDELKWFKAPAYRIQMEEYKKILSKHYGFSKFNKLRAIPIRTEYLYTREVGGLMIKNLKDIEIGNADPAKILENKNYLLPVVMLYESTGNENLDSLITKLNAIYEILANKKVKPSEKNIKAQELNDLAVTIRDLQVRKNINSFVDNGLFEITKYKKKLDNNEFNISTIGEAIKTMRVYAEAQKYLQDQILEINKQINSTTDANTKEYLKNLKEQFQDMIGNATYVLDKLTIRRKEIGDAYAKSQGINTLLKAEKSLDWLKRNFRSTSTLDTAAMQTFYKTLRRAQGIRDQNVLKTFEELKEIEKSYSEWAATNGKSGTDMFEYLLEFEDDGKWNGSFLNIYSKEFNKQRKIALKNSDFGWFKANTVFDKDAYDAGRLEQIKLLEDRYPGTDEKIKKRRDKALLDWEEKHSDKSDFAYINKYNSYIRPAAKWYSDKYKFVYQKNGKGEYVNKPLKDAYEYFQKLTRRSSELGMIDRFSSKFIPSMLKGVEFNVGKILDDLQVHSDQGFSNIDELTGDLRKEIPVYYTKEIDDSARKSQDLFKVFGQYAVHLENYQAMSDIEDISDMLLEIENEKKSYAENQFGKINKTKKINKNETNAIVLENHINYYLYGRETSSNIDKAIKINGTEYSAVKSVRKTLKYMALKTLGLNVLSGTATFVGGTANAFFVGSKRLVFTEGEWVQGIKDYTFKDEITMAAIYQFGLTIEDETNKKLRDLSVDGVMKHANSDALMFIQRTGDKWATLPVSAAMLRTYMIGKDGKLVNIRKHVKSMNNYNNFYNLSMSEQKSLTAKMEAEVQDLMENKSLKATAKIENGKLVIPGMTGNTDNTIAFRGEVQKTIKQIIGNASRQDINQVRMSLAGSIMMQFRSWMPQMMTERFGDLTYDMDMDAWQYGKARLFFKHLANKNILPLIGELTVGFGTNTIEKAKERYTEFLRRLKEEGKITEDSEFMTEAEFIDMYLGNLRSMMRELIMWLGFASLCFWAAGGDDEDKSGVRKWIAKALRKYKNEFAFYYSPGEFTSMLKSPIPIIGLLTDVEDLVTNTIGQGIGFMRGDTEQMDANHPLKYFNKILPITKELQSTYALFDDDFRKSFDIKN